MARRRGWRRRSLTMMIAYAEIGKKGPQLLLTVVWPNVAWIVVTRQGRSVAVFKIPRFPAACARFFEPLQGYFHWGHFEYFRNLVLAMAFAWGRRNISNLYRYLEAETHRTRYNNFLGLKRWDPEGCLAFHALGMIRSLHLRPGETLYFIVDDSKKPKRGRQMEAVDWVYDPVTGKKVRGHLYVTGVVKCRNVVIPWGIRLYAKKNCCRNLGLRFRKTTQLAADLIASFTPPPGVKVVVLFDSYYLCPTVVKACRAKGFHFVSTLKTNRNLFRGGRKLKAGSYGDRYHRHHRKQVVRVGDATYRAVDAGWLTVGDLGLLHVVFSRRDGDRRPVGLVTDDPSLTLQTLVEAYTHRWGIEVFFKDVKQHLGLGQYQNASYTAAVIHLHLVCFAYALLTHLRLHGAQGRPKKRHAALQSTREAQDELRRLVWRDLVAYLEELPNEVSMIQELERLLAA